MHKLSNIDRAQLLADCIVCGPGVPVQRVTDKNVTCVARHRAAQKIQNDKRVHDPAAGRIAKLRQMYKMTPEQWDAMFDAQGRACAICKTTETKGKGWVVDHDHACCPHNAKSCGACVRGILCWVCNIGLGAFKDDLALLGAAREYLRTPNLPR